MKLQVTSGIYMIRCTVNEWAYIGSAQVIEDRWYSHRRLLVKGAHHCKLLQKDWLDYGEEVFDWTIVEVTTNYYRERFHADNYTKLYNTNTLNPARKEYVERGYKAESKPTIKVGIHEFKDIRTMSLAMGKNASYVSNIRKRIPDITYEEIWKMSGLDKPLFIDNNRKPPSGSIRIVFDGHEFTSRRQMSLAMGKNPLFVSNLINQNPNLNLTYEEIWRKYRRE